MMTLLNVAGLVVTTIFAAAAAVACNWLALRVAFHLMQPAAVRSAPESATAKRLAVRAELARGTAQLARALAPNR